MAFEDAKYLILIGVCFTGAGMYLMAIVAHIRWKGLPVAAEVIALKEESVVNGRRRRDRQHHTLYIPVFKIIADDENGNSNRLAGKQVVSKVATNPPLHFEGEVVDAHYISGANDIVSVKEQKFKVILGAALFVIGIGVAVYIYINP